MTDKKKLVEKPKTIRERIIEEHEKGMESPLIARLLSVSNNLVTKVLYLHEQSKQLKMTIVRPTPSPMLAFKEKELGVGIAEVARYKKNLKEAAKTVGKFQAGMGENNKLRRWDKNNECYDETSDSCIVDGTNIVGEQDESIQMEIDAWEAASDEDTKEIDKFIPRMYNGDGNETPLPKEQTEKEEVKVGTEFVKGITEGIRQCTNIVEEETKEVSKEEEKECKEIPKKAFSDYKPDRTEAEKPKEK